MRKQWSAASALAALLTAGPAAANSPQFPKAAFEILGGMQTPSTEQVMLVPQTRSKIPRSKRSQVVAFHEPLAPGSILVRTAERKLYFVLPGNKAIMYHVGVGREGFTWSGTNKVTRKAVWPTWRPPQAMIAREARKGRKLPAVMEGGPENPLGARAIYIGDTEYRIHGTSQPWSIGLAVSSGCIRMMNEQVIDLYNRVKVGATVVVE
jgi:lipoprotein-anchoring transpeptidase ErfK/SrfK